MDLGRQCYGSGEADACCKALGRLSVAWMERSGIREVLLPTSIGAQSVRRASRIPLRFIQVTC
jgi:hypothetical protein